METFFLPLKESTLFSNIAEEELQSLCECLCVQEKIFKRESFVFQAGDPVQSVYFILSGGLHIVNEDFWGNRSIIEIMNKNTLFGEAYVFSARKKHLVSVMAAEDSVVLEIDPKSLFECCPNHCACHVQFIKNALYIVSEKIVRLTEKTGHIMQRTTRNKLLSYLSQCAKTNKSTSFYIPYSRQQLADYLCVDRSALSHELSKLKKNGMLQYQKNHFTLLISHDEDL